MSTHFLIAFLNRIREKMPFPKKEKLIFEEKNCNKAKFNPIFMKNQGYTKMFFEKERNFSR